MLQPGIRLPPGDALDAPLALCRLQTGSDDGVHRLGAIHHRHDLCPRLGGRVAPQLHGQLRLGAECLPRGQLAAPTGQPGGIRQIGPRPAGQQIPHRHPVMGPHGLRAIGAASTGFMKGTGPPDLLECVSFHGLPVPGAILGAGLQHPSARLEAHGRQQLGHGRLLPAQYHAADPWHEAHLAGPCEDRGKGAQQRQPPYPPLRRLVHDASPCAASLLSLS
jgi:hypothetical protein